MTRVLSCLCDDLPHSHNFLNLTGQFNGYSIKFIYLNVERNRKNFINYSN